MSALEPDDPAHPAHPAYSAPRTYPTRPPVPGRPGMRPGSGGGRDGRGGRGGPQGRDDDPNGSSRRAFLLAGAGAVAVLGAEVGFLLNRSAAAEKPRAASASASGAAPAPSPSTVKGTPLPAEPPKPIGHWPLDETEGEVARDTANGNDGIATGVLWQAGEGGAVFDGTGSRIVTVAPVLTTDAGRSFTVAAWARLSVVPGSFATVVSQDAGTVSGFYLQYARTENRWAFARPDLRAAGRSEPAANVWTHLAGVCDGRAGELRLYVNGVQEAVVEDTNPTPATGAFVIGRASYGGAPRDFFPGAVRDVRAFEQALTADQIQALTSH